MLTYTIGDRATESPRPEASIFTLPHTARDYQLFEVIGKGGFGVVYKAISLKYHQVFAVKVIPVEESIDDVNSVGYQAEITALIELDHPNIMRLYDHFIENESLYIVLELCNKGTAEDLVVPGKGIQPGILLPLIFQLISALRYCHSKGIAHCDIKPANLLIGEGGKLKVADFGLARHLSRGLESACFMGSYAYVPPEILKQEDFDPFKSDCWSVGVTIFYLATGTSLFPTDTIVSLASSIRYCVHPPINTRIPIVDYLVRNLVVLDPNERLTMKAANNHILRVGNPTMSSLPALEARPTSSLSKNLVAVNASYEGVKQVAFVNQEKEKPLLASTKTMRAPTNIKLVSIQSKRKRNSLPRIQALPIELVRCN